MDGNWNCNETITIVWDDHLDMLRREITRERKPLNSKCHCKTNDLEKRCWNCKTCAESCKACTAHCGCKGVCANPHNQGGTCDICSPLRGVLEQVSQPTESVFLKQSTSDEGTPSEMFIASHGESDDDDDNNDDRYYDGDIDILFDDFDVYFGDESGNEYFSFSTQSYPPFNAEWDINDDYEYEMLIQITLQCNRNTGRYSCMFLRMKLSTDFNYPFMRS